MLNSDRINEICFFKEKITWNFKFKTFKCLYFTQYAGNENPHFLALLVMIEGLDWEYGSVMTIKYMYEVANICNTVKVIINHVLAMALTL